MLSLEQKPTVLFFIDSFAGGGAERVVIDIVNHWPLDHAFTPILVVRKNHGPYRDLIKKNISIIEIKSSLNYLNTISIGLEIRRYIKSYNVQVIVSHLVGMNRLIARLKFFSFFKTPIILCEHNNIFFQLENSNLSKLKKYFISREIKFFYKGCDRLVSVSYDLAVVLANVIGLRPNQVTHIKNPIDVDMVLVKKNSTLIKDDRFSNLMQKSPRFISVGRFCKQKNFDFLISLCVETMRDCPDVLFTILGDGPDLKKFSEKLCELGLEDHFFLPGFVDNPWWYISKHDAFVMCSLWEGYPLILNEVIACGIPVVAYDCDFGPREIVSEDYGFLIQNLNTPEFSEKLKLIFNGDFEVPPLDETRMVLEPSSPNNISLKYSKLVSDVHEKFQ